jgi:hypothetical protein
MSHYVFPFISFSFICNVWISYKREKKKKKKPKIWGRGVNCEEEIREKKMRWVRGDVCV